MIRKLLCWLGFHEYEECLTITRTSRDYIILYKWSSEKCKHCGKVKK